MADPPLRDEFPILREKTYLNTCSLGAYSTSAERRVQEFYREWRTFGAPAWYKIWWGRLEETREAFGGLVGARAEDIAILPSVSGALAVVASALDYKARPHVVVAQNDFPTIHYAWSRRPGVTLRRVGARSDLQTPPAAYAAAIDEETACVATCHVFYNTGGIQDVKAIARLARDAGALCVVDSYHGAGQLPIDVKELGVDILISGGLKWLLGGPGCALVYASKEARARLHPTATGWFANERQFEFDPEAFSPRPTAARLELGTPSLPSAFATLGGMELVARVGPAAIRKRQNLLVTDLWKKLADAGFAFRTPRRERDRAGIVMVEVEDAPGVVERLAREGIVVDHRDGCVRVSPYFYNTIEENDRFAEAVARLAPPRRVRVRSRIGL